MGFFGVRIVLVVFGGFVGGDFGILVKMAVGGWWAVVVLVFLWIGIYCDLL